MEEENQYTTKTRGTIRAINRVVNMIETGVGSRLEAERSDSTETGRMGKGNEEGGIGSQLLKEHLKGDVTGGGGGGGWPAGINRLVK